MLKTFAVVAMEESGPADSVDAPKYRPDAGSQHFDWEAIDIREVLLESRFELPISLGSEESCFCKIRLLSISPLGRIICCEWNWDADFIPEVAWDQHWDSVEATLRSSWVTLQEKHRLPKMSWAFTLTFLEGQGDSINAFSNSFNGLSGTSVMNQRCGLKAVIDWNGGVIIRNSDTSSIDQNAIIGILTVIAVRWQVDLLAIKSVRRLLANDTKSSRDGQTGDLAHLARRIHYAQVRLLSIYVNNEVITQAFLKAWSMHSLAKNVKEAIEGVVQVNELESRLVQRASNEAQEAFLLIIALVGICGTISGVIASVDFKNSILSSESYRFALILLGTLAIGLFGLLKKPKNGHS